MELWLIILIATATGIFSFMTACLLCCCILCCAGIYIFGKIFPPGFPFEGR
uniref:Transmembrane protein n=1 Tax=Mimivirus LCMiAC02 TaxID=2506609 RepID=A0A4D5XF10_9VIRU|nr:MAG: hypothetical protein LCMiAC02_04300 [Mimivirus LCMiAC02]